MKKQKPHLILMALLLLASLLPMMSYAQFSTDVGVSGTLPSGAICDGLYPITVTVTNNDAVNPTSGPVAIQYLVDGAVVNAGSTTGPLAAGASELVVLGNFGHKPGKHSIVVAATYAGDTNPLDNFVNSAVTVQFNGTYTIGSAPTDNFATLKMAIDTLNAYGVCGPTTINVGAAYAETAPAGGFVLGGSTSLLITTLNSTNTLTFNGNSAIVTASASHTVGSASDAILKLVGVDYITISGFAFAENAANTVTALATNTMTEFAIGIFAVSVTDGAQHNTIQNNTISLGSTYPNAIGVLSTCSSTYLLANQDATVSSGTNSFNKFYTNTINNVAYGFYFVGPANTATLVETGIDVGGSSLATGNNITFGNATTATYSNLYRGSFVLPAAVYFRNVGTGSNVSYNTITSNNLAYPQSNGVGGIINTSATAPTGITYTSTRLHNNITLSNTGTTALLGIDFGHGLSTATFSATDNTIILNQGTTAASSASIVGIKANYATASNTVNSNTITVNQTPVTAGAITSPVTVINAAGVGTTVSVNSNILTIKQAAPGGTASYGSGVITYINVAAASGTVTVNSNQLLATGSSIRSTGDLNGINHSSAYTVGITIDANVINVDRVSTSGTVYLTYTNASSASGYCNYTNNKFSNITVAGTTTLYGLYNTDGGAGTIKSITGNKLNNITAGTGPVTALYFTYWNGTSVMSNDTVTNVTGQAAITGINLGSTANNATSINVSSNIVSGLSSTGTGGAVIGISCSNTSTLINITGNNVNGLSSTGASSVQGIVISGATNTTVNKNKIFNLSGSNASSTVYGITISSGTTVSAVNNFVSELSASTANAANPVIGINISGGTTVSIYHNTVYLNSTSTGALFGSSALYASTTPTLNLINNILVNASTPVGATGYSAAYRRSGTTLTTYSSSSDNNYLYAGTPGANNLIFYDGTNSKQTLADYQAFVTPRDAVSATGTAPFVNVATTPYDLHLQTTVSTGIESGGKTIASVTTDYDGDSRNATTPDIGADEFNGIPSYTCSTPTPGNTVASSTSLCLGNGVNLSLQNATAGTGVTYKWQSSADGVSFSDISGAVSATYSVTPTAVTYYQCIVTCANGPASATSTPVMVGFANLVTSTTPASRCGTGTVSLTASGSAGTTLNWYDASTGGNKVGTGSPWTTPSIAATTTYYASAETASTVMGNVTIGTGTSTTSSTGYPTAFGNYYYQDWFQYVITAAELQATGLSAGNINSISFNISALPSPNTPPTDYQVSIGATSNSTLSAWQTTGLTVCFGPATPPALTVGWNTLTFTTPYNWDGTSNIIIDIRGTEKYGSANATTYYTTTTGNTLLYAYASSNNTSFWTSNPTPTTSTSRLNTRLNGNITTICSSPRVAVTATIGSSPALTLTPNQTVCNNSVATLAVTSTLADYDSYIWSPSANLFTDAACTTPYDGVSSATTVYAKTATAGTTTYTCTSNNSVTLCSNVTTTNVTVTPASVTISSSSSTLCNSGSVSFTATPNTGYGTATFQWQNSSDNVTFNDIAGANTLAYTTPTISSTMYYKLLVKNGASTCFESNIATITVNNPQVLSTTPGNRCGTGTLTLTATSSPGTDINWYDQSANGTKLGTGASFTTPVISATTIYYVEAAYPVAAPATIGAGALTSSSYENPFYHLYGGEKNQYLIPASELVAAGLTGGQIKSIKFKVTAAGTTYQNFTLSMGTTSNSSLSTFVTGLTDVYFNAAGVTPTVGDYAITFTTPYTWDGISNLIVQTSWSNNNGGGTSATISYDNTAYTSGVYYRVDNTSAASIYASTTVSGTLTKRPAMMFSLQECASNRIAVNANINTPPAINVTATPTTLCLGDASALNVNSTNAGYSYAWSTGTTPSTGTDVSISPVSSSSFTVTATDNSGGTYDGCVALGTVNITVNPKPTAVTASTNHSLVCMGNTVDLSSTADFTQHLIMENGDGGFENGSSFALNNWTVVNGSSNNWYVGSAAGVQSGTNAAFTGSSASSFTGTANSSVNHFYKDVIIPAGVQNISLSFYMLMPISDDTYDYLYVYTTNTANTPVAGTVPGTGYTNIFTYTSPAVSSYTIKTISLPDALAGSTVRLVFTYKSDAYSPYAVFAIDNISMLYETPGGAYSWASNPAGFTSSVQNPTGVTPTANTQYTVTATNSYNCSNTASVSVNVDMPSVGGTATATATQICAGTGTSVSLAGNLGNIQWQSSADGTTWANVSGATTATLNTGNLSDTTHFRAVITNGLCGSAFSTVATVNTLPQPTVTLTSSANPSICNGGSTTIDLTLTGTAPFTMVGNDGSGPATFPGLGATVNLPVSPIVNTTYTVVSVTDANNCVYNGGPAVSVTVNSPSVGGDVVAADNEICSGTGTNVTLSGNTGGIQWQSSSDNITFANISGETNSTLATGNLTTGAYYRAIVTSGVCSSAYSDTTHITVNALPSVSFTGTLTDQCINNTSYTLTGGLPAGGIYSGTGVTGTNFDASVAGAGTKTITYTYTDGTTGCINSATNTIDVNTLPSVTFAGTLADQCVNNTTYTLTGGTPAGGLYSGTGVTGTNFDASVAGVGTQTITYTYTDATTGCINSTTNTIDVNALPSVTFAGTLADQCANNTTYTLTGGTPAGGVYSGTGVTGTNFDASVAGVGTETITYSYTDGTTGCASSTTNTIDVIAVPATPVVTYDNTGGITVLTSSASAGNQWYNTSGIISGETNATYTVTENGSYYVQVTVNGCTSANSNTIVVDWITGIVSSESLHFNIYPNPSSDRVSIESDMIMTAYSLYDETGKLIETRNVSTDKLVIAVANLNSGVYYIRIQTSEGWFIQPVQVQNK